MKKTAKLGLLIATAMVTASGAAFAQSKDVDGRPNAPAYVMDARGNVVFDPVCGVKHVCAFFVRTFVCDNQFARLFVVQFNHAIFFI